MILSLTEQMASQENVDDEAKTSCAQARTRDSGEKGLRSEEGRWADQTEAKLRLDDAEAGPSNARPQSAGGLWGKVVSTTAWLEEVKITLAGIACMKCVPRSRAETPSGSDTFSPPLQIVA
jgi:hypothetical protein